MSTNVPEARQLVRALVARSEGAPNDVHAGAHAAQSACERTIRELTRSIGAVGARVLLLRALVDAGAEYHVLASITPGPHNPASLEGVPASLDAHGDSVVAEALEALLERLLALMGRLIGDDLVQQLVGRPECSGTTDEEGGE
ncbi:MAG: hypothetical protein JWO05_3347 [Gemmatimonadetes bacterium]|nr:hypothetical protein [Gemmatimonadota bacterium]